MRATDEWRQPGVARESGPPPWRTVAAHEPVGPHGSGTAADRSDAGLGPFELPITGVPAGALRRVHLTGLGKRLQPSGEVDRVSEGRLAAAGVRVEMGHDHETRVQRNPHPEGHAGALLDLPAVVGHRLLDVERRVRGTRRVILLGHRRSEHGHQPVPGVVGHGALVPVDALSHEGEAAAHDLVYGLRVQPLGERRVAGHVGEEHRDVASLPVVDARCRRR